MITPIGGKKIQELVLCDRKLSLYPGRTPLLMFPLRQNAPMQLREELHRVIDHILKKNLFHQEHFLNELLAGRAQTIKIYAA